MCSSDLSGQIIISSNGAVLPAASKVAVGADERQIALVSTSGSVVNAVPFYTRALGLNTIATNFEFAQNPENFVFSGYTLSNGNTLGSGSVGLTQFYF